MDEGGPLVDVHGEVVGLTTAVLQDGQGLAFAIPAEMARKFLEEVWTYGRVRHVRLGIRADNAGPEDFPGRLSAVRIKSVAASGPGDKAGLNLQEQVDVDEQAPLVAGQRPTHVRLLANGDLCSELVVIKDTMNDAVAALSEMKTALARVQAATLNAMPLDRRTPCDMAMNVYAPARSLGFGLPLQERSEGRSQSLVDFSSDHEVDDALFALPEQFDRRPLFMPGTT